MNAIKRSLLRWALCLAAFVATWLMGLMATGFVLYRSEALLDLWLSGIGIFSKMGLLSSLDGEGWEDAVLESLAFLWLPVAAWVAWYVNRWLKRQMQISFTQE